MVLTSEAFQPQTAASAPAGSQPLLAAHGLTVAFGGQRILDQVDVAIHAREIVTVIGLNGSGKTTLARALLGLVAATSGHVSRRPGLRVGYVPQAFQRDPALPMTAARFVGLAGRTAPQEVGRTLELIGAAKVADTPLTQLSGGELRRIMLARALVRRPHVLVLDEPLSGVDVAGQADFYRLIGEIRARDGCGVLLISHDLHLVMAETDTVICLNHHICCAGRPQAVLEDPSFAALFGQDVAHTLAVYRHAHDHVHGPHGEIVARSGDANHGRAHD